MHFDTFLCQPAVASLPGYVADSGIYSPRGSVYLRYFLAHFLRQKGSLSAHYIYIIFGSRNVIFFFKETLPV